MHSYERFRAIYPYFRYRYLFILLTGILSCCNYCYSSSFLPIVNYYSSKDYNASHQNWSASQADNGLMYFANSNGLMSYDGYRWNIHIMPKDRVVRSVMCDGNRIYTGAFEEFGYFEPDSKGELKYNSLSGLLKGQKMNDDEIWKIFKLGKYIYFQSFSSYYKYDGKTVISYNNALNPLYLHDFEGRIFAQIINDGLYELKNDKYVPFISKEDLRSNVISIMPGRKKKEMMLITENNGIYFYNDNDGLVRFRTDIDNEIMANQVNRVTMAYDSAIIIGTTMNGVYALDRNGHCKWHFNRDKNLNNNTVLGLYCDMAKNIWVCMDDGISYIHYNSPITLFSPALSELKFGMVFDIYGTDKYLYLATNQGLYKYDTDYNQIQLIPNTEAQNWFVTAFDNQIFCGNNYHSMSIKQDVGIPASGTSGSTCIKKCIINGEDILIESSYNYLHIYRKDNNGQWKFSNIVKGLSTPLKQIEVDASGTVWASHMYSGLYQITLNSDLTKVIRYKYIPKINHSASRSIIPVFKIFGRIIFNEDDRFYTYDDLSHKIVPYEKLGKILPGVIGVHSSVHINDNMFWLVSEKEYNLMKLHDNEYEIITKLPFSVFENPCLESEADIFVLNKRYSYFNLNNCVARYDCEYNPVAAKQNPLEISFVQAISKNGEIRLSLNEKGTVSSNYREIIIELLFPHYDNIPIRYVYTLKSSGTNLKSENYNAFIRFSSLNTGDYSFEAVAYNPSNQEVGRVRYEFSIDVPFFMSLPAVLFYIIIFVAFIYLAVKWNTRRIIRLKQKEYEKEQIAQLIKLNEQERLISEQNKQILESELTIKSKELASMAMGAIAKNNALEELKNSIKQQMLKETYSKKFLNSLINQINENIENKEFWEVFQQNFDLIHANFFRNLRKRFPELTPTDLKFCALIRLNMTTKDIAQMTNLTIRGVEAARYRIRKKLGITESESMVNFLIEFK